MEQYKPDKVRDVRITTKIILTNDEPITTRPRQLSPGEKKAVDEIIGQWLENGIIRPSSSKYASATVLVKKKDDSIRLCIDYRPLNEIIVRPKFPLPLIDDQLDALEGAVLYGDRSEKRVFLCTGR